jgi:hypothetical protein
VLGAGSIVWSVTGSRSCRARIFSVEHAMPSRHLQLATRDVYAASLVFTVP